MSSLEFILYRKSKLQIRWWLRRARSSHRVPVVRVRPHAQKPVRGRVWRSEYPTLSISAKRRKGSPFPASAVAQNRRPEVLPVRAKEHQFWVRALPRLGAIIRCLCFVLTIRLYLLWHPSFGAMSRTRRFSILAGSLGRTVGGRSPACTYPDWVILLFGGASKLRIRRSVFLFDRRLSRESA